MASLILPVIHAPLQLMVVGVPGQTGLHVTMYSMEIRKGKEPGNATILNLQMEEVTALETGKKLKIVPVPPPPHSQVYYYKYFYKRSMTRLWTSH